MLESWKSHFAPTLQTTKYWKLYVFLVGGGGCSEVGMIEETRVTHSTNLNRETPLSDSCSNRGVFLRDPPTNNPRLLS